MLKDVALYAGLTHLPPNIPYVLWSFGFFSFVHLIVAPLFSLGFFKNTYGPMDKRARNNWYAPFVSRSV